MNLITASQIIRTCGRGMTCYIGLMPVVIICHSCFDHPEGACIGVCNDECFADSVGLVLHKSESDDQKIYDLTCCNQGCGDATSYISNIK